VIAVKTANHQVFVLGLKQVPSLIVTSP